MKRLFLVFLAVMMLLGVAQAQSLTLTWDAPTENTDGTPLSHTPLSYTVYCGSNHGTTGSDYTTVVPDITDTTYTFVHTGTYYCRVTATNTLTNESAMSDECTNLAPNPPTLRCSR